MPLIIHPSSCCDVCLETFTYDAPKPPHAIPCGHIFCRACLHTMHPSICPLCRKAFSPERAKKIITGEGESDSTKKGIELMEKLIGSWDMDTEDEQLVVLTLEVQAWLDAGNTSEPLIQAQDALRAYHILKREQHDGQRTIRRLRRECTHKSYEKDTANAIAQSLRTEMEELQTKVTLYETEIERLRAEILAFRTTKNPLPPPPEPFPLDQLPPFDFGKRPDPYSNWHTHTNGHQPNGYNNGNTSEPPTTQMYTTQNGAAHPPVAFVQEEPLAKERSRDRKGKGKAREPQRPQPQAYDIYAPSLGLSQRAPRTEPEDNTKTDVNGLRNAIIPGASPGQRFMPKSVFEEEAIPEPASWGDRGLGLQTGGPPVLDPFALTAEYINEYAGGYNDGYNSVQPHTTTGADTSYPRSRSVRVEPVPRRSLQSPLLDPPSEPRSIHTRPPRTGWMEEFSLAPQTPHASRHEAPPVSAPIHSNFHSSTAQNAPWHHSTPPAPLPSNSVPPQTQRYVPTPHTSHNPHVVPPPFSSTGYAPVASQFHEADGGSAGFRPRAHRRRTVQPDGNITDTESASRVSDASTIRPSGLRRRSAVIATRPTENPYAPTPANARRTSMPSTENPYALASAADAPGLAENPFTPNANSDRASITNSLSSWGTINTANPASPSTQPIIDSARFISSHAITSVRDLQLRSFDDINGARGSIISNATLASILEGMSLSQEPAEYQPAVHTTRDHATPRNRAASFSESVSTLRPSSATPQGPDRPQDRRLHSYPEPLSQAPHPQGQYYGHSTGTPTSVQPPETSQRSGRIHRRHASLRQSPAVARDDRPRSPMPEASSTNALGLSNITPSPHITAPTPVVSSRAFLRSFSNDNSFNSFN